MRRLGDVNLYCYGLKSGVLGELLALFSSGQGSLFINVCKEHAFGFGLGKGDGCFFASAAGGLREPSQ